MKHALGTWSLSSQVILSLITSPPSSPQNGFLSTCFPVLLLSQAGAWMQGGDAHPEAGSQAPVIIPMPKGA